MSKAATSKNNRRRAGAFLLVGLGVIGLGAASASTLRTDATYADVAAGSSTISVSAACDNDIDATFAPTEDYTTPTNGVTGEAPIAVTLSEVNASCTGKTVQIAVYQGDATTPVGETAADTTLTVDAQGVAGPIALTGLDTNDTFDKVSIVIG